MEVSDHIKSIWEKLLNVNEVTFTRDCDDDFQGIFLLLQVFGSCLQRFADRCRVAENSLLTVAKERSLLDTKCSELQRALLSEKAKKCSQCSDLQLQVASLKEELAEKTKPCSQCKQLHIKLRNNKKFYQEKQEKWRRAFNNFLESRLFSEEKCNTAMSYVSQMIPFDEDEAEDSIDSKSVLQQKATVDTPKRKSPCSDVELNPGSRKRKSPCVETGESMEPPVSHLPQKTVETKGRNEEDSKFTSKPSSSKKAPVKKPEVKIEPQGLNKYNIIVPETLPSEPICPVVEKKRIIIPETLYPEDDFVEPMSEEHKTPKKEPTNGEEDNSPVLSVSKKPGKPLISAPAEELKVKEEELETVENEQISPLTAHPKSPSVLAVEENPSIHPLLESKDRKVLDEFFDEIDKNAGNSRRSKTFSKDNSKVSSTEKSKAKTDMITPQKKLALGEQSSTEKSKAKTDIITPQKKLALGEKNVWSLHKPPGFDQKKKEEKICPKKMKQTTLSVVTVPKNQDVSHNDSFNGGVLAEVMNDENDDSDDSECLILPSPKNDTRNSSRCESKKLKAESIVIEQRTGTLASLEETYYFAPPVTSTCLSLSRRNKPENEEKSEQKPGKDRSKIQNLDTSFDHVPRKTNSPTYKYKEDPVRKRDERQQLPGWDCDDCAKYYAMGVRNGEDPKELMNKCSRHRSKYKDLNVTVKGFWDPCIPESPSDET
ncbi:unnamed protein product [Bemisia tabaci]|uniref:DNA endonuclease RBBP8 n=1 Tax=Bemisia tabaci TaxID=7038 RepID=A0A9P0AGX9_BEMTA|nr:unnamed protein product [Bemisia tabaci]